MTKEGSVVRIPDKDRDDLYMVVKRILGDGAVAVSYPASMGEDDIYGVYSPDELVEMPPLYISGDVLRQFLRREINYSGMVKDAVPEYNFEITCNPVPTLDDLEAALTDLKKTNADYDSFHDWAWYLFADDSFEVFFDCSSLPMDLNVDREFSVLPQTEQELLLCIIKCIAFYADHNTEEEFENFPLDDFLEMITNMRNESELPIEERHYSDFFRMYYVSYMAQNDRVNHASEKELQLYRKYLDEYCEEGRPEALQIKAYDCYGGDAAYECDWELSREYLEKFFKETGDPYAANTLGYIYYYGRTNRGKPNYAKALKYFSIGATCGIYESMYKLGDMYLNGYGIPEMRKAAANLYREVYEECVPLFCRGQYECKLADAALRIGGLFEKNGDYENAYAYYLQADLAIRKRMETIDYYGDNKVRESIRTALENAKEIYHAEHEYQYPSYVDLMELCFALTDGFTRRIKAVPGLDKKGNTTLQLTRLPLPGEEEAAPILLTFPVMDWCGTMETVTLTGNGNPKCESTTEDDSFIFNHIKQEEEDTILFCYDDEVKGTAVNAFFFAPLLEIRKEGEN